MGRAAGALLVEVHQDVGGDAFRAFPVFAFRLDAHRAVAGEGELAAGGARCALEDYAASRVRIAVVCHAVGDDFGDGKLAFERLTCGFVIHGLGHAHQFGIDGFGALDFGGAERGQRFERSAITVAHRIAAHGRVRVTLQRVLDGAQPGRVEQRRRVGFGAHGKTGILIHREAFGFGAVLGFGAERGLGVRDDRQRHGGGHRTNGDHPATDEDFTLFLVRHA